MGNLLKSTYHAGNVVLDEKLISVLQGKKLPLILADIFELSGQVNRPVIDGTERQKRCVKFLENQNGVLISYLPITGSTEKKPMDDRVSLMLKA